MTGVAEGTGTSAEGRSGDRREILEEGLRVVRLEARAVSGLEDRMDETFVRAVELLRDSTGRVVVSGIGKSGIIGRKLSATLTSTGTPANFIHPVEGLHGDLGMISADDVAVLISKSGATDEMTGLLEYLVRMDVPVIAMTGRRDSPLARYAEVVLDCTVDEEACPMDLAPTSSTTATLAMADALAMALLREKGFRPEDFARIHPGGSLGRKLTLRVEDVMVTESYPWRDEGAVMRDLIVPLAEMRGTVPIVDEERRVVGVVTTGDLTRLMEHRDDFLDAPVREVMTRDPKISRPDELAAGAVHRMEEHGVMALPVVEDAGRLVGIVHLHDLMRSGAV